MLNPGPLEDEKTAQAVEDLFVSLNTKENASAREKMAWELYVRGLSDFITVLDAQRQQFATERDLEASRAAVLRSSVAL